MTIAHRKFWITSIVCLTMAGCKQAPQHSAPASPSVAGQSASGSGAPVAVAVTSTVLQSAQPPQPPATQQAPAPSNPSSSAMQQPNPPSPLLEDIEHHFGPFLIGGKEFSVAIGAKHIKGQTAPGSEADVSLEIRDAQAAVVHHETFGYSFDHGEFVESCNASTEILSGSKAKWLLITSECEPSAPMGGGPWEIFGDFNGKFTQYGGDIYTQGEMLRFVPGAVTKVGTATSYGFDSILFKVWTGNFYVTLPVKIELSQPKLTQGIRCLGQTGHGLAEIGCQVPVEAKREPSTDDTFVRLFDSPQGEGSTPSHVVIHPNSKVEFLAASARIKLDDSKGSIGLGVADDVWLQVRIDGKIGWIHTQEDFVAIGLPEAG
jgi:hypothetical protein